MFETCCRLGVRAEDGEERDSAGIQHLTQDLNDSPPESSSKAVRSSLRSSLSSIGRDQLTLQFAEPPVAEAPDGGTVGESLGGLATPSNPHGMGFRSSTGDLSALASSYERIASLADEVSPVPTDEATPREDLTSPRTSPSTDAAPQRESRKLMRLASNLDNNGGVVTIDKGGISEGQMINIYNPGKLVGSYTIGQTLGTGSFGTVRKGSVIATGAIRAIKSMKKQGSVQWKRCMEKELQIFKLTDHPNIVKMYEVFEDKDRLHLVLEYCAGGELHDRISHSGVPEPEAALVMFQLLRGVVYLHKKLIAHRDLKAQNLLITTKGRGPRAFENTVRITDFGLSCIFVQGQFLTAKVGTFTHMSPQVIMRKYTHACDSWACGVILYHLLSGYLPFEGSSDEDVAAKVKRGRVSFGKGWSERSPESIELCQFLLYLKEDSRSTPLQALDARWVDQHNSEDSTMKLDYAILENLRSFRKLNKLKKAILSVVASMLTEPQIRPCRLAFFMLDKDGDGSVSVEELRNKLLQLKEVKVAKLAETRQKQVMEEANCLKALARDHDHDDSSTSSPALSPRGTFSPRNRGSAESTSWKLKELSKAAGLDFSPTAMSMSDPDFSPEGDAPVSSPRSPILRPIGVKRVTQWQDRVIQTEHKEAQIQEDSPRGDVSPRGDASPRPARAVTRSPSVFRRYVDDVLKDMFADDDPHVLKATTLDGTAESDNHMPDFPYTEWLAATFDRNKFMNNNICLAAFRMMDKDQDGVLNLHDIGSGALLGAITEQEYGQILEEVDVNGDGQVDLEEFTALAMGCRAEGWTKCFHGAGSTIFE